MRRRFFRWHLRSLKLNPKKTQDFLPSNYRCFHKFPSLINLVISLVFFSFSKSDSWAFQTLSNFNWWENILHNIIFVFGTRQINLHKKISQSLLSWIFKGFKLAEFKYICFLEFSWLWKYTTSILFHKIFRLSINRLTKTDTCLKKSSTSWQWRKEDDTFFSQRIY